MENNLYRTFDTKSLAMKREKELKSTFRQRIYLLPTKIARWSPIRQLAGVRSSRAPATKERFSNESLFYFQNG